MKPVLKEHEPGNSVGKKQKKNESESNLIKIAFLN